MGNSSDNPYRSDFAGDIPQLTPVQKPRGFPWVVPAELPGVPTRHSTW